MKRNSIFSAIKSIFSPGVIPAAPLAFIGAIPDPGSLNAMISSLALNGAGSAGNVNFTSTAGTTLTLSAVAEACILLTAGAAVTLTLDSAYNIGKLLPQPLGLGQTFRFRIATIALSTFATPTLSDTAVTLAGVTSGVAGAVREFLGSLTQVSTQVQLVPTPGTTLASLVQVGATNNYTVTLGTNANVPVVGNLVYLGVTAGTLPAGWYPINKVTSATSFVIAAPASTPAWTATAATVGNAATAPLTYSPLMAITGLFSVVGAVTA